MGASGRPRRGYLDWLRGLAVLVMIEAHTVDAWTRGAAHGTRAYALALIVGGFGAPLFLFLAGVAVPLSAGSKARRFGDARTAVSAVCARGLEIFVLAFLFRLQSFLASPGSTVLGLFKVDILNIMGPAIVAAALLWWAGRTVRGRLAAFTAVTVGIALVTPLVRESRLVDVLPVFVQWYVRPVPGHTTFTIFPWAGFVFAGGVLGVLLDRAREPGRERLVNLGTLAAGAGLTAFGLWAGYRPALTAGSDYWTTSPAFFDVRVGIMCVGLAAVYLWDQRPAGRGRFDAVMELMGRESLFVYWIHVEMVYGLLTSPIHRALPLAGTAVAYLVFAVLMYGAVRLKGRVRTVWSQRRQWLGGQPSLSA